MLLHKVVWGRKRAEKGIEESYFMTHFLEVFSFLPPSLLSLSDSRILLSVTLQNSLSRTQDWVMFLLLHALKQSVIILYILHPFTAIWLLASLLLFWSFAFVLAFAIGCVCLPGRGME